MTALQIFLAIMLASCLGSFAWGMRRFFRRPDGTTIGMRLVKGSGIVCGLLHFAAILASARISAEQGVAAAFLYSASLVLFWWSTRVGAGLLAAIFSVDTPARLVEGGPYRFIRHPFYCSYILAWAAGLIATGELWLLPTVIGMTAMYLTAANIEERRFLRSQLAEAYQDYRARTGQLLPNPFKSLSPRRSS